MKYQASYSLLILAQARKFTLFFPLLFHYDFVLRTHSRSIVTFFIELKLTIVTFMITWNEIVRNKVMSLHKGYIIENFMGL